MQSIAQVGSAMPKPSGPQMMSTRDKQYIRSVERQPVQQQAMAHSQQSQ